MFMFAESLWVIALGVVTPDAVEVIKYGLPTEIASRFRNNLN